MSEHGTCETDSEYLETIETASECLDTSDTASEYLHNTLGKAIAEVLQKCADNRPEDPIAFLADAFEK